MRNRSTALRAERIVGEETRSARRTRGGNEVRSAFAAEHVIRLQRGTARWTRAVRNSHGSRRTLRGCRGNLHLLSLRGPGRQAGHRQRTVEVLRIKPTLRGFEELGRLRDVATGGPCLFDRALSDLDRELRLRQVRRDLFRQDFLRRDLLPATDRRKLFQLLHYALRSFVQLPAEEALLRLPHEILRHAIVAALARHFGFLNPRGHFVTPNSL